MENLPDQNMGQANNSRPAPKQRRRITSWIGFVIIVAVALILFGGVFAYQYFFVKPQPIVQTPQTQADQTAGWKTYANTEYGFEIKYPQDLPLTDQSSAGILNLKLYAQAPDYKTRSVLVASKNSVSIKDLLPNKPLDFPGTIIDGQEKFGSMLWNKKEVIGTPVNGIGTYGDSMTYYLEKNNLIFSVTCYNCVPPPDGGAGADSIFKEIVSTFKFTTSTNQTADWKTYTNTQYGFEFKYPATEISVGQIAGSVLGTVKNPINGICVGNLVFVVADNNEVKRIAEDYYKTYQSCEAEKVDNPNMNISAVNCYGEGGPAFYAFIRNEKVDVFIDGSSGGWTQNGSAGGCGHEQISDSEYAKILSTFKFTQTQAEKENTAPVISSIVPASSAVGSAVEMKGSGFAGFEGDLNLWIEKSAGVKGIIYGDRNSSNDSLIKFTLPASACQHDTSYSGLPCPATLQLVPGNYKIFVRPWSIESNKVNFQIK